MAVNNISEKENQKLNELKQKAENARIKMFIQTFEIKEDTNMTRIYSALKNNEKI